MDVFKLVVLGDEAVGKTSLLHRFVYNTFKTSYKATLGVDVLKKSISDLNVELSLWDFSGQKVFEKLRSAYYAEAKAAFIVFDVTRKETFESIKTWQEEATTNSGEPNLSIIVLANKTDLGSLREVSQTDLEEFKNSENIPVIEISAKTGENVEKAFRDISKNALGK